MCKLLHVLHDTLVVAPELVAARCILPHLLCHMTVTYQVQLFPAESNTRHVHKQEAEQLIHT